MSRLCITGATAIPMDADRRIVKDAVIVMTDDRIDAVGPATETPVPADAEVIDGRGMIALPGLIDSHTHAGHALTRNLGAGDGTAWFKACEEIYTRGSTAAFWQAEARLAALERLKGGITTCATLLGGGRDNYRTDTVEAGDLHCAATREFGLRTMLAVGPNRPPFPKTYRSLDQERSETVRFEQQLETCEKLVDAHDDILGAGTGLCLIMPVFQPDDVAKDEANIRAMTRDVIDLRARLKVPFTQDGHRTGSIAFAEELGLLGPHAFLSHCVDLTEADRAAARRTGASIVHNPSAIMSIYGRCPAPELLDDGVNVALGSDAAAPDRGYDMFRHMAQCLHYHRRHFRDPAAMKPATALEMCTINGARAMGLQHELGSLEPGKKADLVLVDRRKPHLFPPIMPVTAVAHFANAADVDTVIVDGKIRMRGRMIDIAEAPVLEAATSQLDKALERTGLGALKNEP